MFVCRLVEGGFTDLWLRQMNERAVKERRHSKGQVYESAGYSIWSTGNVGRGGGTSGGHVFDNQNSFTFHEKNINCLTVDEYWQNRSNELQ